jgi:hypothetical protein
VVDAQVAADADQPGLEVGAAVEGIERLVQLQENVLREVFGLVVAADELIGDVEHPAPVRADNRLPRRLIAIKTALNDFVHRLRGRRFKGHDALDAAKRDRPERLGLECAHDNMRKRVPASYSLGKHGLACDGVALTAIAESIGTPVFVYSAQAIRDAYTGIDAAFAGYPHAIHYALKANSTLALLRLLRGLGSRADANSGGEIQVALRAGFTPADIVFTGVGKTREELEFAVATDVGTINAESPGELDRIAEVARALGRTARVALRVNPDIDAKTHANISTGLRINKFGVALEDARGIYRARRELPESALYRRARPHRVADHQRRAAAARGRGPCRHRPAAA